MSSVTVNETPATASELLAVALALLQGRRIIGGIAGLGALVGVTVSLLLPPSYSVSASFVPQSGNGINRPGLSALASQFGVMLPGSSDSPSPQFYAELMGTRGLLVPILDLRIPREQGSTDSISLAQYLDLDSADSSRRAYRGTAALKKRLRVGTSKTTGVISVQATFPRPDAAYLVTSAVVRGVDSYNAETRRRAASEERVFVESRLIEARASLREAEVRLEAFQRANRRFTESPDLVHESERIGREISLRQQISISLAQSLEDVRIREVRNAATISVVEPPRFNSQPEERKLVLSLVLGLFVGAALGAGVVVFRDAWQQMVAVGDPVALNWLRFVQGVRGG